MSTPGRNDPCHCGSGEKYKRCHLRSDTEAHQSSVRAHAADVNTLHQKLPKHFDAVATAIDELRQGRLSEARLSQVRRSLRAGGSLRALRYDHTAFEAATTLTLAEKDPWRAWELCAPTLVPQADRQRDAWVVRALEVLESVDPGRETDQEAVVTTIAILLSGRSLGPAPAVEQPLFGELFVEQWRDLRELKSDAADEASGSDSTEAETTTGSAIDALKELLTGETPPPLLTLDGWLSLDQAMAGLLQLPTEERSRALAGLLGAVGGELGPSARDRAARLSVHARLSPAARDQARVVARAWHASASSVLMALLRTRSRQVLWRSSEERSTFAALDRQTSPEALRRYARWLDARGETEAAGRMDALARGGVLNA